VYILQAFFNKNCPRMFRCIVFVFTKRQPHMPNGLQKTINKPILKN
jgi:hypothetical protein